MLNKKCKFEYTLIDTYTAGIMLNGPEVKAICENRMSFGDAFCSIEGGEMFMNKFHISVKDGGENDFMRKRKLLLNRKEIDKIEQMVKEKGLTIVPTAIYFNDTRLIKVDVAVAKGKKQFDKRETIKKRDLERAGY